MAARRRDKLAEATVEEEATLRGDRSTFEQHWQSIARYCIPRDATFTEEVTPGVERQRWVLDSTAPRSLELFASFIHTLMNNPATVWFDLGLADGTTPSTEEKRWFEAAAHRMLAAMDEAGVYSHLHQMYLDLGYAGTGNLYVDVINSSLRIRAYHLADMVIAESEAEEVDTVHRRLMLSPRQAKQRWGEDRESLGETIDRAKGRAVHRKHRFLHSVFPMTDERAKLMPAKVRNSNAPFASVWVNAEDKVTVSVGSYEEFPYVVPRWYKVRGEVYGRSPAMTVLPDIRMVNRMTETILRGAEKLVDPPLVFPDGGLVSPIRMFPGGISFTEGTVDPKPLIPPGASRIEVGDALMKGKQDAIREGFFVPLFITPDSPVKTATQVLQEVDERNRAVSPMMVRLHQEGLSKLVLRVFNLMSRNGLLPEAPASLEQKNVNARYISPLSGSQRQMEGLTLLRLFESVAPWSEVDDVVWDQYDVQKVARILHDATGAPADALRSKTQADARTEARNAEAQQAQAAETAIPALEAAAKLQAAQRPRS